MNYKEFDDLELLNYIAEADTSEINNEIMFEKYKPYIIKKAKEMIVNCNNLGIEIKDLIQEGYLGLNQAIETFDESKNVLFYTYAKTCVDSKMLSFIISAKRLKHKFLNESISFELDEDTKTLENVLIDNSNNPELQLIDNEVTNNLVNNIKEILTPLESQVFDLKINHFTYKEIANLLNRDPKTIDNAIQRIKIKVKNYLDNKR